MNKALRGWHEGKHDPWPYINYVLFILKSASREFEERVGQLKSPKGAKTELIKSTIDSFSGEFSLSDLERACPGVSRDMIRRVLRELKSLKKWSASAVGLGHFGGKEVIPLKRVIKGVMLTVFVLFYLLSLIKRRGERRSMHSI